MTSSTTFTELVREAFIDPIRSALIVDDQYPTWEEIFCNTADKNAPSVEKEWRTDSSGPCAVINQLRSSKPSLLIDIHDAAKTQNVDEDAASAQASLSSDYAASLHQSDLLILDYYLEGSASPLKGKTARGILNNVLSNQHFNLVIIHTSEEIDKVYREIVLSCLAPATDAKNNSTKKKLTLIDEQLESCEANGSFEFSAEKFYEYFSWDAYLAIRNPDYSNEELKEQFFLGNGVLGPLKQLADDIGIEGKNKYAQAALIDWAAQYFESSRAEEFASTQLPNVSWSFDLEKKWLRSDRGFVAFSSKGTNDLLDVLAKALESWKPTPSRLLSAKFRHEISCNGVSAEDQALSKRHVFANFYDQIVHAKSTEVRTDLISQHVDRHSETLAYQIKQSLSEFGLSIFDADDIPKDKTKQSTFAMHYGVNVRADDERKKSVLSFNRFVSSLPLGDDIPHLSCGHIFTIDGGWWICASPACDLVPDQNSIAFHRGDNPNLRPFKAIKLTEHDATAIDEKKINSNQFCFIERPDGEIKVFSPIPLDENVATNKVTWRMFFAKNDGKITGRILSLRTISLCEGDIDTEDKEGCIEAQLRYEYALNYLNKVGVSVTRIGLGYTTE